MSVCPLPFFSWKGQAMTKVMKAEVDRNGNSRKVMEKKYSNLQPPPPKKKFGGCTKKNFN